MSKTLHINTLLEKISQGGKESLFQVDTLFRCSNKSIISGYTKLTNAPVIYLSSGIHGDEPAGPVVILELLQEGFFNEEVSWMICPILNPSGLERGTRENAEGIDLNRDYLAKTTKEVQSHVEWLESQPVPDLFISLHEDWESTGFYLYEINVKNAASFTPDLLKHISQFIELEPERVIDEHETHEQGWIYHAAEPDMPDHWPEAIYMAKRECPLSLTLETPSSIDLRKRIDVQKECVREIVRLFLKNRID